MQNINIGNFYFIDDAFLNKYPNLMKNKTPDSNGIRHDRPCFAAFQDIKIKDIFWLIPISSDIQKYTQEYNKKLNNQKAKGIQNPKCDTIYFGKIHGSCSVFLLQNMFPVILRYISGGNSYKINGIPVTAEIKTENDVIKKAKKLLKLAIHNNPGIFKQDVLKMYADLCDELKS